MEYITGNKFKRLADYVLDEGGFRRTGIVNDTPVYFVKTDLVEVFFTNHAPASPYKLITHNSDYNITDYYLKYLQDSNLVRWFAQNVNTRHPKVESIPIGLANEIWAHGEEAVMQKAVNANNPKNTTLYCNFNVSTNRESRTACLDFMNRNNVTMAKASDFNTYLQELSKSLFTLSPDGNGIDCHRTWEALYLKTIPVVVRSIHTEFYRTLPILVIESWEALNIAQLNENTYRMLIDQHSANALNMHTYRRRITSMKPSEK